MKLNKIFVGINGSSVQFSSGARGVAVYVASPGSTSYVLLADGTVSPLKGARVNGMGVAKYFASQNFELAKQGDASANRFADELDALEGDKLISTRTMAFAQQQEAKFDGQRCTAVPFSPDKPVRSVTVKAQQGSCTVFDLRSGFHAGQVSVEHNGDSRDTGMGVRMDEAWLVGPEGQPETLPRLTEYGGVIEHAVYVICNSGTGQLVGARNLGKTGDPVIDTAFIRGALNVLLTNGDTLIVGIHAGDELGVQYRRAGTVLYEREGLTGNSNELRLDHVIGAIAAAIVRAQELDADAAKKKRPRTKSVA